MPLHGLPFALSPSASTSHDNGVPQLGDEDDATCFLLLEATPAGEGKAAATVDIAFSLLLSNMRVSCTHARTHARTEMEMGMMTGREREKSERARESEGCASSGYVVFAINRRELSER